MKDGSIEIKLYVDSPESGPDELSLLIGRNGSEEWKKGDLNAGGRPYRSNSWEVGFGPFPDHEMDKHLGELMDFLTAHGPAIRDLVFHRNCSSYVSVLFRKGEHSLGIPLEAGLLKTLGECGIGLDMNVYDL